ncbi:hypothetical protein [Actinomadura roseirufa]|uniref:hypothetical protein n=1 Tax=Actinomadura roseirufa TaxID=2094049 RepID=UPI001041498B|nr:hypothetical protein [Actinomadura roseirufa]
MAGARLDADRRLVRFLSEHEFTGPAYRRFEEDIVRYGIAVIGAWTREKLIFDKCRGIGIVLPWPGAEWPKDDQLELTWETVGRAAVKLRGRLIRDEWDPGEGATLNTFFIRGCLYEFPGPYLAWHRAESRRRVEVAALPDHQQADGLPGPEDILVARDEARRSLSTVTDEKARTVLILAARGYTHAEIAHLLGDGATARSVEGMLYRQRNRFRRRRAGGARS